MTPEDRAEIARYMGLKGTPDPQMAELIERSAKEVFEAADPRTLRLEQPLLIEAPLVAVGNIRVASRHLSRHLEGCCSAVVFAATLGADVDRLVARASLVDSAAGFGMQAAAAVLIEKVCDRLEEETVQNAKSAGLSTRSRFSPGYGDFDLSCQTDLLRLLDAAKKIGLGETAAHMLTPLKSVTAVIGIGPAGKESERSCESCSKTDCIYRKETTC